MLPNPCVLFLLVVSLGSTHGYFWGLLGDADVCKTPEDIQCQKFWVSATELKKITKGVTGQCGKVSFSCLEEILTDSDSPQFFKTDENSAVFWSGDQMETAQKWAELQNPRKYTLEQTLGGEVLNSLKLFEKTEEADFEYWEFWNWADWGSKLTRWGDTGNKAAEIFDYASKYFADNAGGDVNVFSHCQAKIGCKGQLRTWWRLEAPAIKGNRKVKNIIYRKPDATECAKFSNAEFDPTKKVEKESECP